MKERTRQPPATGQSSKLTQAERFAEAAQQLGADDDEATFKAKLAAIAPQKPKDEPSVEPSKASAKPRYTK